MNFDFNQIQNQVMTYFKNLPQDEIYAYGAAALGLIFIIVALML